MAYSTHTGDALMSRDIRVPVCIEGTTFDMQLDTAADVSLLPESLYRKRLSHAFAPTIGGYIPENI